jgi:hypothetical protein
MQRDKQHASGAVSYREPVVFDRHFFDTIKVEPRPDYALQVQELEAKLARFELRPLSEAARTLNNVALAVGKTQGCEQIIFKSGKSLWLFPGLPGRPTYTDEQKMNGCWCFSGSLAPVDESAIKGFLPIDVFHRGYDA